MPKVILLFFLCLIAFSSQETLEDFRLRRILRSPHVQKPLQEFITKTNDTLAAPTSVSPDKVLYYEPSREYFRRIHPTQTSAMNFVETICQDKDLSAAENKFLEQRKWFTQILTEHERTTKVISLIQQVYAEWKISMEKLAPSFTKRCGKDEKCLENRQLQRFEQINKTALAYYSLNYLKGISQKNTRDPSNGKALEVAANKYAEAVKKELLRQFDAISSRQDLPW